MELALKPQASISAGTHKEGTRSDEADEYIIFCVGHCRFFQCQFSQKRTPKSMRAGAICCDFCCYFPLIASFLKFDRRRETVELMESLKSCSGSSMQSIKGAS